MMHALTTRLAAGLLLIVSILFPTAIVQAAEQAEVEFNIPAQPLASALTEIGAQAKVQVLFDEALVKRLKASAIKGRLSPQAALDQLLRDTGLVASSSGPGTFTVQRAKQTSAQEPKPPDAPIILPQVTVQDTGDKGFVATRSAAGTKTDTPLIEVPAAISVVTRDQMDAQNVQSAPEALRYTSGVVPEQRGINTESLEYVFGRGFYIDQYLNGLRLPNIDSGFNIPSVDAYLLERVELLHGPASVLYGQTSPGGLLNLVSKRPITEQLREVMLQTGTDGRAEGGFDFGGSIDSNGHFLYRLTSIGFGAGTQVDHYRQERFSIAPALTWQPNNDTRLTILTNYKYVPKAGFYNLMPANGMVLPNVVRIRRSFDPGDPDFDKYHKQQYSVGYAFEHRFNDIWSVKQNFRYMSTKAYIRGLFADEGLIPPAPDGTELGRFSFFNDGSFSNILVDQQAQARFDTGPLRHEALVGLDFQRNNERHIFMGNFSTPPISIVNPVYGQEIPYPDFLFGTSSKTREWQTGLYAQDQIRLWNWAFLFGVRQDWVNTNSKSLKTFETTNQSDNAFTWRAGLVYLFEIGVAPYFSYSESFQPEIGADFDGNPFRPTTAQQYEVGVKYQPKGFNSFITLAAYHLTRQNVLTDDPNPDHFFASVQTGEVRVRGIELEGHASLTNNLDLVASYTFTDAENTKSNGNNLHKGPTGIPQNMASLWANYKIPLFPLEGLQIGAGVRYIGSSFGDQGNTFKVPSYTLFDAALRYDLAYLRSEFKGWQVGVNGTNLADKTYVSQCLGLNDCSFGLARRVLANVKYRW